MKTRAATRVLAIGTALACTAWLLAPLNAAAADAVTVKATGQAAIRQGDKAQAYDNAIADAQRKAVEQAIGTMISAETVTENFQLISDKIYSQAKGYLRKYKVLSKKIDGGVYAVTIEAEVSSGDLSKDLEGIGAILRKMNMPRVLVMITEQNVGSKQVAWWQGEGSYALDMGAAENALIDSWTQKGFSFVDRQALQGKLTARKALTGAAPSNDQVKEFALGTGAEVVIIGTAFANDNGPILGTKMHSLRANISLRALAVDTGRILATATTTSSVGHIDAAYGGTKALDKVARKAGAELLTKVMDQWKKAVSGPAVIALTITGVKKSKYLRKIATFLGNDIRGVQDVRQRSYRKKVAEFEVEIKGSGQTLAEELEEKNFGDFEIEIDEITPNTVKAVLKTK